MSPTIMRRLTLTLAILLSAAAILPAQQAPEQSRFQALDRAIEKQPPEQRIAYNALLAAFATFREARAHHEICVSDKPCAETPGRAASHLNSEFLAMAEGPSAPTFTAADLAVADAELNTVYDQELAALPPDCAAARNCLSQGEFREIQRDWIRYRDSWVTFALLRFPASTSESWLTLLTRQRTTQLKSLP